MRVKPWAVRKHGEMTQVLAGHGYFHSYLHRMAKAEDNCCKDCGTLDTAEHLVFHCTKYDQIKGGGVGGGDLRPETLMEDILLSQEKWTALSDIFVDIIRGYKKTGEAFVVEYRRSELERWMPEAERVNVKVLCNKV